MTIRNATAAGLMLITEPLVADIKEDEKKGAGAGAAVCLVAAA